MPNPRGSRASRRSRLIRLSNRQAQIASGGRYPACSDRKVRASGTPKRHHWNRQSRKMTFRHTTRKRRMAHLVKGVPFKCKGRGSGVTPTCACAYHPVARYAHTIRSEPGALKQNFGSTDRRFSVEGHLGRGSFRTDRKQRHGASIQAPTSVASKARLFAASWARERQEFSRR